jgi:alpha-galactosidase
MFHRRPTAVLAVLAAAAALALPVLAASRRPAPQEPAALRAADAPANAVWLDSLDLEKMVQRRGRPRAGRSGRNNPLTLGGVVYPHGIGTLSINQLIVDLKGGAARFVSMIGIDDDSKTGQGSVVYEIWIDNRRALVTDVMRAGDPPRLVSVDLTGARFLELLIDDGGDVSTGDYADWAGAMIVRKPDATTMPEAWTFPAEPPPPIASGWPAAPRINPPRVTGGTPGRPFFFLIPATGEAPLTFSAKNLPAGLTLDAKTGIIRGSIARAGRTDVQLTVVGPKGRATADLTVVGGDDALALTPPLGWNSWNVWGDSVDDAKVRAAADWMVQSGLAAHGFQFVNIDDGWEGQRDADGVLQPNAKFPDMNALADYVHAKGLKLGIYSSPGPRTCQGLAGSYQHEAIDAKTWAAWGIDLLKYDWCSYEQIAKDRSLAELQKPYLVMRDALRLLDRDIVFSLCQYGMGNVWEWGAEVGGHYWRTSGDLTDVWSNMASVGFRQAGREKWSKPGHWTDPDMLVVGKVGWGPTIHDTRLTPNEQITHITLWAMQAAPLLIGADMSQLDRFTVDLLTNHEVLDVSQDVLGRGASRVWQRERLEVWARPLADGTTAVGLFSRGLQAAPVTARWSDIGVRGRQPVRDLWQQRDLGAFADAFTVTVPAHGAVLIKVGWARTPGKDLGAHGRSVPSFRIARYLSKEL